MTRELSVVIPTFNERDNVEALIDRLATVLDGLSWEVVFVDDDSPDGTADAVAAIATRDDRVRCIRRIGRRGLSAACIEGILSVSAPYVAVMDADLQHDEALLPRMLEALKPGAVDIAIGSRYAKGGGVGDWASDRAAISRFATRLGRMVIKADLEDPMSGFFMVERHAFLQSVRHMSGTGFKILLDLFASSPRPLRFVELPYTFRRRHAGESKLDTMVAWEYLMLLGEKLFGGWIPVRFVLFVGVGALGLVVHLAVLGGLLKGPGLSFPISQTAAVIIAMTFNFIVNNVFTYHDKRLKGLGFLRGLISFYAACSLGALINLAVAIYLFDAGSPWWLAGAAGAVVGAVWNYAITATFTWKSERKGE
ncbi:MAG: glycosyltransferase family 2 protein [Rhodospirillales bacterium]|jgi:dolichol-phosphate mannosyltransferase|nr:glycosyltransferase family 2 protein [Rhodospirillales bacterium]MDP6882894.1 glycosyltransferase family 2 protein [Rhodospirillales bacterium]